MTKGSAKWHMNVNHILVEKGLVMYPVKIIDFTVKIVLGDVLPL